MATVTGLRAARGERVLVEVDGELWRTLPAEIVLRTGLAVGRPLDRPTLREVRRQLRRTEALAAVARALRHRDLSRRGLGERLERAAVAAPLRDEIVATLERAGLVDDDRVAHDRADRLARRGLGDDAIRYDLEQQGLAADAVEQALESLPPERERALSLIAERGATPRTARLLASRGFGADAIEAAIGTDVADAT